MSELSESVRKSFKESDDIRDAGLVTPDTVERFDDILYGSDSRWQVLDVYRPKDKKGEKLPVIVSIHGGAWVYGDKERYQYYCMSLAERGFAVVNFTYRLAPDFKYPCCIEDANLVFEWVLANGKEYGFDTDNIFAVGDSAGAHILSLYAAILTNSEYAEEYPFKAPVNLKLNAIALNCGMGELTITDDPEDMLYGLMADLLPGKGTEEEMRRIAMKYHVTKDYPPVFIMTAVEDFLKMQAPIIAAALTENNVPFTYKMYGDKNNPLQHVFHCDMRLEDAKRCNDEECEFFRNYIQMK